MAFRAAEVQSGKWLREGNVDMQNCFLHFKSGFQLWKVLIRPLVFLIG